MRSKSAEIHPSTEFDYGPLFGGGGEYVRERPQSTALDPDERLAWARRALLASNLETFTAETVRELTVQMRPHHIGSGRWIGAVFHCPLFDKVCAENAQREEAAGRTIWRYSLSAEGRSARAELVRRSRCGTGPSSAGVSGSSPEPVHEAPPDGEPVADGQPGRQLRSRPASNIETTREGRSPSGFHTPGDGGSTPSPAPNNSHGGIEHERK